FLFSTLYLWYKTLDNKKNELISLLIFLIFSILIALLYSFSLTTMDNSISKNNTIDISLWSYVIFFTTLLFYIFYECKDWIKKENTKSYLESNKQYDNLKDSFKNLNENE